jgi:hypothetical protein
MFRTSFAVLTASFSLAAAGGFASEAMSQAPEAASGLGQIGVCSLPQYAPAAAAAPFSDQTAALQDFLMACQAQFNRLRGGNSFLLDQYPRAYIRAVIPGNYAVSSPIVIPPHVLPEFQQGLRLADHRILARGVAAAAWSGDPSAVAQANAELPMMIAPPGSSTRTTGRTPSRACGSAKPGRSRRSPQRPAPATAAIAPATRSSCPSRRRLPMRRRGRWWSRSTLQGAQTSR